MSRPVVAVVFVAGATAVIAWAGATWLGGQRAADEVDSWTAPGKIHPAFVVMPVQQRTGLLSSSGSLQVTLDPNCLPGAEALPVPLKISYDVKHAPSLAGLVSFEARVSVGGEHAAAVRSVLGTDVLLTVHARMGWDDRWHYQFATPEIVIEDKGPRIHVAASTGTMHEDEGQWQLAWSLPNVAVLAEGKSLSFDGISVQSTLTDLKTGLGRSRFHIGSVRADQNRFDNLELVSESVEHDEVIDTMLEASLAGGTFERSPLGRLGMKFALNAIDAKGLKALTTAKSACPNESLDRERLLAMERAAARIFDRGFTVAISDVGGSFDGNAAGGAFEFALASDTVDKPRPLVERISVNGNLAVDGELLAQPQRSAFVSSGFVVETPSGLRAEVSYKEGHLRINGALEPDGVGDMIFMLLSRGDDMVAHWRAGLARGESLLHEMIPSEHSERRS